MLRSPFVRFLAVAWLAGVLGISWWSRSKPAPRHDAAKIEWSAPAPAPILPRAEATPILAEPAKVASDLRAPIEWPAVTPDPRLSDFRRWAERYVAAPAPARATMVEEGRRLAEARAVALHELVENDPRAVLGQVLPYAVRREMPAEIAPWIESRVSARAALSVIKLSRLVNGQLVAGTQRAVTLGGEAHEAFTFGEATRWWSQLDAEINGVVLPKIAGAPRRLAFSPYPARLLEPAEARDFLAANQPQATCPVSTKRLLEDGETEIYVVRRSGLTSPFCSLPHAQSEVGGLPPEGWDIRAYGGPDTGPLDTSLSLPTSGSATGTADTTVTKKLNCRYLLIRQSFTDAPAVQSDAVITTSYTKYADALKEGSYGQRTCAALSTTLNTTDTWLLTITMPATKAAYAAGTADITRDTYDTVRPLLQAAGQDYTNFDHFVMIDNAGLIGGGQGSYGPWFPGYAGYPSAARMGWSWDGMNSDTEWNAFLLMHECGHNLYLPHAHRWLTNTRSIIGAGSTDEYGDGEDAMGGGDKYRSYDANHRLWLGWIQASDAPVITTSGTYRVQTYDENAGPATRMLRVRSPLKTNVGYFVQRHTGINGAAESGAYTNTVSIRWGALNGNEGWRLDTSQGKLGNSRFYRGSTFSDRRANVHITPLADVTDTNGKKAVDVYVAVNPPATNRAPVISAFTVTNATPAAGANVTFSVTASDPDGDTLAYAFDSGGGEPNKANSATLTRSFTAGEYPVQVRVSDMKGGVTVRTIVVRAGAPTTYRISGTVYNGGDPAPGMLVTAGSAYASTDDDGTYTLTNLAAGTYTVAVRDPVADEYLVQSQSQTISTASLSAVDFYGDSESDSVIGLTGTYYAGTNFNTLKVTRRDPEIDFAWADGSPAASVPVDGFSARWTGRFLTPKAGGYHFHLLSDEGARLYIDNVLTIDRWSATTLGEQTAWVPLAAGRYPDIKVEYKHVSGTDAQVRLSWTPPGAAAPVVLPDGALTPKTNFWVSEWYGDTNLGTANYKGSRMELATPNYDFGATAPDFPGISSTNFSVRWLGRVTAGATGTYTFHTDADDGTRLWVNGTQLINDWTVHGVTEKTGTIALTTGQSYDVVLEYFQGTGGASVKLSWTPPAGTKAVIPIASVLPPVRGDHLYAELFSNKDLSGDPAATRWDQNVDFNFGTNAPDPRLPTDAFSVRWSGRVLTTTAGTYTFETSSDDGVRLYVNGATVIDDWTSHTLATRTGTITLAAATWYDIRLEYFDNIGSAESHLRWKPPGASASSVIAPANLAVSGGNTAPFASPIAAMAADVGLPTPAVPFTIGDPETAATALTVTATSSNTVVVPNAAITLSGTDAARTVSVTPAAAGSANITVSVSDGTATTTQTFVVTSANNGGPATWVATTTGSSPWSGGANWQAGSVPVSGNATTLEFLPATTLAAGAITANNDLAGTFTLNALSLSGAGRSGAAASVTLAGNPLILATRPSAGTAPSINLVATKDTAASSTLTYNVSAPVTLGADSTIGGAGTADFVFSGPITGAASLTKTGTSTLILTGPNSYSGTTTIGSGGILFIGRNTATGTLGSGPVNTAGSLRFHRSDTALVVGNAISGTGNVQMGITSGGAGGAIVTLTGANTFTGNVTINSGGLRIRSAGALGTGTKTLVATNGSAGKCRLLLDGSASDIVLPATLSFQTSNSDTALGAIINEAGNNTIAGNFTLTSGGGDTRIRVAAGSLTLSGNISPNTTARSLVLDGAGSGTFSGALLDNGTNIPALGKDGAGQWTLTGTAHTFTGATTVTSGMLVINGSLTTTSSVTVASAGTLSGNGTIGAATTINGTHAPGAGLGTLTHTAALTYGAASHLAWELGSNSTTAGAFDQVAAAGVTIAAGAKLDPVFNRAGSTVDFSSSYWSAARSWPVLTSTSLTGTFALGTVSADPAGRVPAAYGTFSLTHAATGVTLSWTPYTQFQSWQWAQFGASMNDPNIAGPDADPDHDGLTNFAEWAFGLSANQPNSPPTNVAREGANFTLTYTRASGLSGVTYQVKWSDTLSSWSAVGVAEQILSDNGTVQQVKATVPSAARRFLRLEITKP